MSLIIITLAMSVMIFSTGHCAQSALWGKDGELWKLNQPLKDFSFAGYLQSEVPIPDIPKSVSILDFGGRGDGKTDVTQALLRAIAACPAGGKVFLPAGDYLIADLIEINKSLVIAGAGMNRTRLILPKYLVDLHPRRGATGGGNPAPLWSCSACYFYFNHPSQT